MRNLALLAIGTMVMGIACASRVEPLSTTPSSVEAAIASATLGNDCGGGATSSGISADCAEPADAGEGAGEGPGEGRGGCGGYCQQSNVQLALVNSGTATANFTVAEVHLIDAATGTRMDDVDARNPRVWTGSSYASWDSALAAGKSAKVSFDLTQFDWTKIGGGNSWNTFSRRYKIEVVLRVDGVARTLVSGELSREPEVVT